MLFKPISSELPPMFRYFPFIGVPVYSDIVILRWSLNGKQTYGYIKKKNGVVSAYGYDDNIVMVDEWSAI